MTIDRLLKTSEFRAHVSRMFPNATSLPLHKTANTLNPGVDLDIQNAVYNMAKKAYFHRKSWGLIGTGIKELDNLK